MNHCLGGTHKDSVLMFQVFVKFQQLDNAIVSVLDFWGFVALFFALKGKTLLSSNEDIFQPNACSRMLVKIVVNICFAFFQDLANMMKSFRYDAHPMGMLATTVCAMGTIQSDANPALRGQDVYDDKKLRNKQIQRLIGSMPTMAAFAYRHRMGK